MVLKFAVQAKLLRGSKTIPSSSFPQHRHFPIILDAPSSFVLFLIISLLRRLFGQTYPWFFFIGQLQMMHVGTWAQK